MAGDGSGATVVDGVGRVVEVVVGADVDVVDVPRPASVVVVCP